MGVVWRGAAVAANVHSTGVAGEHALDGESGPFADTVSVFIEEFIPALIESEEQFCGARDIHSAEYKTRQGKDKGCGCSAAVLTPEACYCSWLGISIDHFSDLLTMNDSGGRPVFQGAERSFVEK